MSLSPAHPANVNRCASSCAVLDQTQATKHYNHWRTPPHWIFGFFWIVCLQNIVSKMRSCTHWILNFLQENVKKLYTNFRIMLQLLWNFALQTPYRGFAPGPHWGLPSPDLLAWPPTTWTPSIEKSWVRLWLQSSARTDSAPDRYRRIRECQSGDGTKEVVRVKTKKRFRQW